MEFYYYSMSHMYALFLIKLSLSSHIELSRNHSVMCTCFIVNEWLVCVRPAGVPRRASGTRSTRTSSRRPAPDTTCLAPTQVRTPPFCLLPVFCCQLCHKDNGFLQERSRLAKFQNAAYAVWYCSTQTQNTHFDLYVKMSSCCFSFVLFLFFCLLLYFSDWLLD